MDENNASYTDPNDTSVRIYTLAGDPAHNYLMDYDSVGLMNQPGFWRAIDTRGLELPAPAYINKLEYPFWD